MAAQEERHPWLKGFTIGTLVVGIFTAWILFASLGNVDSSSAGGFFLAFLIAGLCIWGPIWILRASEGFKRWSKVPDGKKLLAYLIMFPGLYAGIAVIVILAAIGAEFKNASRN